MDPAGEGGEKCVDDDFIVFFPREAHISSPPQLVDQPGAHSFILACLPSCLFFPCFLPARLVCWISYSLWQDGYFAIVPLSPRRPH